jgi:hypothetical protein
MYKFLVNNGQQVAFGLGLLVTIIFLVGVFSGIDEFSALPEEERVTTDIFNFGLTGSLILTVIAAAAMVFFGLYHILINFRTSLKGIIGVALLIVVFIVGYSMASAEPENSAIAEAAQKTGGITDNQMKFIGGSIITALALIAIAALAFVLSELRNFFK